MRILLAEDDELLGSGIKAGLTQKGFHVDWVRDGVAAERELLTGEHQAVVLDLGLPRQDGMDSLKAARARRIATPVLVLTARDAVADRVVGLDSGADDYLVKPFDLSELLARMRALLRRRAGRARALLETGVLRLDPVARSVEHCGQAVALSSREFTLLHALMETPDAVLSREQLEDRLYGWGEEVESNAVEVHIHNLRRKLNPQLIRTVRGVGYRLDDGA